MSDSESLRRKHSSVDLQQVVTRLDVYNRPLNSSGGKSGTWFGIFHEAAVATTENGQLYLIEKGVDRNDDVNYLIRYRENGCRIVLVTHKDIRDWQLVKSVKDMNPGITLEDLFIDCGQGYNWLTDNCWNGTHRMRARANDAEDGLTWQGKAAIGGAVALVIGLGAVALAAALSSDDNKEKSKSSPKKPRSIEFPARELLG